MATEKTLDHRDLDGNTPNSNQRLEPKAAYQAQAPLIFEIFSYYLSQEKVIEAMHRFATVLEKEVGLSHYNRYIKLVCLKEAFQILKTFPHQPTSAVIRTGLSLEQSFSLLLRDRYQLACSEISAVLSTAEGSIRTRLERSRKILFGKNIETAFHLAAREHHCYNIREQVEDWNPSEYSDKKNTPALPAPLSVAIKSCSACEEFAKNKILSSQFFTKLEKEEISSELAEFPSSPLFVKEGSRFLLNWTAAPWYIKVLFEGVLATTLVLGVVISVPRIKRLYEFWLERRLDLYSVAELASGLTQTGEGVIQPDEAKLLNTTAAQTSSTTEQPIDQDVADLAKSDRLIIKPETEFAGRESEKPSPDKIYRILIKTDAPESLQSSVLHILSKIAQIEAAIDGAEGGLELPGGIMFDVFVPLKDYRHLVNALAKLGETKVIITRSKERKIQNKAHFKIWLQRV